MVKETLIIDGVDVAECKYLYTSILPIGNDKIKCGLHQGKTCDNYPNCYFKQLKRKEKKLEKIKEFIEYNEWCLLDNIYKELLQIIEDK